MATSQPLTRQLPLHRGAGHKSSAPLNLPPLCKGRWLGGLCPTRRRGCCDFFFSPHPPPPEGGGPATHHRGVAPHRGGRLMVRQSHLPKPSPREGKVAFRPSGEMTDEVVVLPSFPLIHHRLRGAVRQGTTGALPPTKGKVGTAGAAFTPHPPRRRLRLPRSPFPTEGEG